MNDFFGKEIRIYTSRFKKVNPMVIKYGHLEGKTCKNCVHLQYRCHGARTYSKCGLRGITRGPGTDHLVNWEACKQFKEPT